MSGLEQRIKVLEDSSGPHKKDGSISSLLEAIEAALAKQRAVNEATMNALLTRRGTMDQMQGDDKRIAALRETLK